VLSGEESTLKLLATLDRLAGDLRRLVSHVDQTA
jgi:hypothetical protein